MKEAELKTIKTAMKMGIAPRAELGSPEEAKKYIDLGVRNFSIGADVRILFDWWKQNGNELRELLSKI